MLAAMRRGVANLLVKVLLGLLIFALALWGIGDYIVRAALKAWRFRGGYWRTITI